MRKVKKIKKIPKYFDGTQSIAAIKDPIKTKAIESGNAALSAPLKQPDALTKHNAQQMSNALNKNYGITPMQNVPEFMGLSINNTMLGAAASVAEPVAQAFGIEQGKAGQTIGAIGKAVGMVNPAIGAALQIAGATAGGRATLDRSMISTTSNVNDAVSHNTGWIGGLMGADRDALLAQASGIQNSKMAVEQTANKQLEWANDPTNQGMVSTLKEGGVIIGDPSKGLTRVQVDSREVITDKNGNNAVRLPYAEGTDSIPALIQPTYKVFSADRGYADIAEKITKGTKEGSRLRQIETNNLAIIQEMTKIDKPNKSKVLHASNGEYNVRKEDKASLDQEIAERKKLNASGFIHKRGDGTFVMQDINGNQYDIPEHMLWGIKQADNGGYYFDFTQSGVAPSAGKWNGSMNYAKQMLNAKNIAKLRANMTKVLPKGAKPTTSTKTVDAAKQALAQERAVAEMQRLESQAWLRGKPQGNQHIGVTTGRDVASQGLWNLPNSAANADNILVSEAIKNSMPYYLTLAGMIGGAGTFLASEYAKNNPNPSNALQVNATNLTTNKTVSDPVVIQDEQPQEDKIIKAPIERAQKTTGSSATNTTSRKTNNTTVLPPVEIESINANERVKIQGDKSKYALYNPDNVENELNFDFKPIEVPIEGKVRTKPTLKGILRGTNWGDLAYEMSSILTPLLDREKAETTRLERPTWHGIPVAVDVSNQLRDSQLGYTLANYNTAQGGYTAGQQLAARSVAASDLARQRAAIHQWQTEQQNKNIAQNIASYNDHSNILAEIANKEIDINAANRAAAKNINRQNKKAALKNWGQIRKDRKLQNVQFSALNMYAPAIKAVMEDPYSILNPLYNLNS